MGGVGSGRKPIHGNSRFTHPRAYRCWYAIRSRCYNQEHKDYKYYGGRGVEVCERWRFSLANFIADMGEPPVGLSIDRINNDGHYEPGNCRWADSKTQTGNKGPYRRRVRVSPLVEHAV